MHLLTHTAVTGSHAKATRSLLGGGSTSLAFPSLSSLPLPYSLHFSRPSPAPLFSPSLFIYSFTGGGLKKTKHCTQVEVMEMCGRVEMYMLKCELFEAVCVFGYMYVRLSGLLSACVIVYLVRCMFLHLSIPVCLPV